MIPSKIVAYGNAAIPAEQITALSFRPIEITPVPDTYPVEGLQMLAPFDLVLIDSSKETDENLERIRTVRNACASVPMILTSTNPTASFLVQAYRCGITDCLLAPYNESQLASVVSTYLNQETVNPPFPEQALKSQHSPRPQQNTDLYCQFLGPMHLQLHGTALRLPGGLRQRSMLAFFLFQKHHPVHRDRIIEFFWPNHDPDCAKNNLNVGICTLRRYLHQFFKEDVLLFRNGYFQLHSELQLRSDLDEFQDRFDQAQRAERRKEVAEAAGWYRLAEQTGSTFLEEFQQEPWTLEPRRIFREKYLHALQYLGDYQQKKADFEGAIGTWRRILQMDICLERAHQGLMECYISLGNKEMAVRQYQECAMNLSNHLGLGASTKTQALRDKIYKGS